MHNLVLFAQNNQGDTAAGTALLVGLVCIGLLFYFLPTCIAYVRGHQNAVPIFALNLLLGWTFLGWVAALVWSFTAIDHHSTAEFECPHCQTEIASLRVQRCPGCGLRFRN